MSNYLTGNDPSQWHTNVSDFARVKLQGVYPGVDLIYHGNQGQLEYDFTVAPGADPGTIRLAFQGADSTTLNAQGDLVLHTAAGDVVEHAPVLYQEIGGMRQSVSGRYLIGADGQVGFAVGSYDTSEPLVIDPTLSYSTFLGGSGRDEPVGIAVDGDGNVYVTGVTESTNFPLMNPVQPTNAGNADVFVTKLNAAGSAVLYSTYLGGNELDIGQGITVDSSGSAYVCGSTRSNSFPTTPGALQPTFGGASDAFMTKLNAAGSGLVYSTYLGGSFDDQAIGIALDSTDSVYVAGSTYSADFPITPGSFQPVVAGQANAFVAKVNAAGSALVYSTALGAPAGGSGLDSVVRGIAVDPSGAAYVTGFTEHPTSQRRRAPSKWLSAAGATLSSRS